MDNSDSRKNLTEYLKKNFAKGYTMDSLKWALINQGYPRMTVEAAIQQANKELAAKAPILKEKPMINYEIIDEVGMPVKISWWKRTFGRIFLPFRYFRY